MDIRQLTAIEPLHEGAQALVYRARRASDGLAVIAKILRGPYPTPDAVRRFRREAEITQRVQGPGIIGLHEARLDEAQPLLLIEDFGAISLADRLRTDGHFEPSHALEIALDALAALARVHGLLVVHKDVNPANLVYNAHTKRLALIDFGIASTVSRQHPQLGKSSVPRGTLPYVAPEQTGRMNRAVDYRADYYSLGVTLYQLLTGALPFDSDDPLELVHAHVARRPPDPRELAPAVGEDLAAVVTKLLAKTADDRYQSPLGLRRDLERCLASARGERPKSGFTLAAFDRPVHVQIPGRLYGRSAEVKALVGALSRVAAGSRDVVLVRGSPGVGKTSLVGELHRPMVETGGLFVSGKFDQFRRGVPYASLSEALGQLCQRLLTGDPREVERWRTRVSEALGEASQVLVDLVGELGLLLGPQPPAPEVPPADAEQRLHRLFRRLISALATPGQPLVLFVDDLQWADLPTIRLFERLATDPETSHLLLIGAWREGEVGDAHPLTHALDRLRAADVRITELALSPLGASDVAALLADSLHTDADELTELSAFCLARTGGNPFFLAQFARMLEQHGALAFDHTAGRWRWDATRIAGLGVTDNVVELMELAIGTLPERSRRALCVASILGSSPSLETLSAVIERPVEEVRLDLRPAQEAGLLIHTGDEAGGTSAGGDGTAETYAFVHDRVEQAALGLLPADERRALHLRAGRILRDRYPDIAEREELFHVVEHLGEAADLMGDAERLGLARLQVAAGRRARAHAATEVASRVLARALALLGDRPFEVDADLARACHREAATVAYLGQDYDGSDRHVAALLAGATTPLESVEALEVRMASQMARNQSAEAIATALEALAHLGVQLPAHPDLPQVMAAVGACGELMETVELSAIATAAILESPERQAAMRLLNAMSPAAYLVRPLLLPLLATTIVRMTVTEGLGAESAYGFAIYGLILCDAGALDVGYAMGSLALTLTDRFPEARRVRVRTRHVHFGFVRHWKEPLHGYLQEYADVYTEAIDIADFEFAHFAAMLTGMLGFHAGVPFDRLEPLLARYTASCRELSQEAALSLHGILHQVVLNLQGRAADPLVLQGDAWDEAVMLPIFQSLQHPTGLFVYHCFHALALVALGELDLARTESVAARAHVAAGGTATFHLPAWHAVDALLALRHYEATGDLGELEHARAFRDKVQVWADANPANLAQKAALLRAEFARVEGRTDDALAAYRDAIQAAAASGFLSDEALTHRLLAAFFESQGLDAAARAHLLEARYALQRWGAIAAVEHLDVRHPDLARRAARPAGGPITRTHTFTDAGDLDAHAVLRASQAISQELVLSRLLQLLIELALESSGARKAALLLQRDGAFVLAAVGRSDPSVSTAVLDPWLPVDAAGDVPLSVVHLVRNMGQEVMVADARADARFAADPCVVRRGVRSVLCLPIVHQGEMNAILYLDNDETEGVFVSERIALARVLLAQAAISIENAVHYEELEDRVRARTAELEEARAEAVSAHEATDALLKNTLPESIAEELKATGQAPPVFVPSATVLFTDFCDFTERAEKLTPGELVRQLEESFTAFDAIIERWGVEKLKTIGDAYMAVGGVPRPSPSHVVDCIMAALEIARYVESVRHISDRVGFEARIGLHTGPLVAGVIGQRRFAYDVWGDAVNLASRMESAGLPGRVNVSEETWQRARAFFVATPRGPIAVKGKQDLEMHFIDGLRPELSEDGDGVRPNAAFWAARAALR
ncbi:MAG: adenylate/guanylate cyclase domain-containing protein [Myxococcota bacterium]